MKKDKGRRGPQSLNPEELLLSLLNEIILGELDDDNGLEDFTPEQLDIMDKNDSFLKEFCEDLIKSGLKENTISGHYANTSLYLDWLACIISKPMQEGLHEIDNFMGDPHFLGLVWPSPDKIKKIAASLKKFYKSMLNRSHISESGYREFLKTVKEKLPAWQRTARELSSLDPYDGDEIDFWELPPGGKLITDEEIWEHPLEEEDMAETWSPGAEEPDVVEYWSPFSNL